MGLIILSLAVLGVDTMKLVVDCKFLASYAPFMWSVLAVNEILSSEDALRAWIYPAVKYQTRQANGANYLDFPSFYNIIVNIGTVHVVAYSEPDCGTFCMVAIPGQSHNNSVVRSDEIAVTVPYFSKFLEQPHRFMANARFHVLASLLHECTSLMFPHILQALSASQHGTGDNVGGQHPTNLETQIERTGDFGYLWDESIFGGVLVAPEPLFETLFVVQLVDCTRPVGSDNLLIRWAIPPAHCARVLQEIDRWVNPTGLGRVWKSFRRPCPVAVFDALAHIPSLPTGQRSSAEQYPIQSRHQEAPSVHEEGGKAHEGVETAANPPVLLRPQRLRADPTQPATTVPPRFYKSEVGLYYTTRRDAR